MPCETPQGCHRKGDSRELRVSLSEQDLLCMAMSEHVFWEVRRVLNRSNGKVRYHKTCSTGRKYKGAIEGDF